MKNLRQLVCLAILLFFAGCSQNVIQPGDGFGGNSKKGDIQSIDSSLHTVKQAASTKRLKFAVKRKSM